MREALLNVYATREKMRVLLISVLFLLSSFNLDKKECKKIQIVPFEGKNGKSDKFQLSKVVRQRFEELGYQIIEKEAQFSSDGDCQYLRCLITHSENYWQLKNDVVELQIVDKNGKEVKTYRGHTGEVVMTFKSGYTAATNEALNQIKPEDLENK
ncbi:hypothetical protein Q0590_36685 [Rhodocytophaga aerolata]|uniref:Uncharacterized protein n=1 Tax=Rhodocytophaga aerolata TaxID=455078 RepID=A0ABT8RIQ7_9BACT|nr:hypothetical protein [Rhodocytophaga aerolata]MDO1451864.1 hypothetical protein [Rhodocytophaga aerolata]